MDQSDEARTRRGVKFDGTINLGHVLTMLGVAAVGSSAYFSLEKRVSKQEDMAPFVQQARELQDARFQASLVSLADDVKQLRTSVDNLSLSVKVQSAVTAATKGTK